MSGDVTTAISAMIAAALTLFDSGSKVAIAEELELRQSIIDEQGRLFIAINLVWIPHPIWMVIGAAALTAAGGWIASR